VGVGGGNIGFAEGVFVGVFVEVIAGVFVEVVVGIIVVGVDGGNVGFAEGVPVGGPDLISISPLFVSLNTLPVTVPYSISEQFVAH
jgi:hypothetical protein